MTGNILIVDDEAQLRKLLARIISLEGFKVTEADSLKAAANHLGVHAVDVVLCDVKLPDGNGVDFVKTSTGHAEKGATVEAVQLMRKHLPSSVSIKASGGIRTYSFAKQLIDAGANRIGCSGSVAIIEEERRNKVQSN